MNETNEREKRPPPSSSLSTISIFQSTNFWRQIVLCDALLLLLLIQMTDSWHRLGNVRLHNNNNNWYFGIVRGREVIESIIAEWMRRRSFVAIIELKSLSWIHRVAFIWRDDAMVRDSFVSARLVLECVSYVFVRYRWPVNKHEFTISFNRHKWKLKRIWLFFICRKWKLMIRSGLPKMLPCQP